MIILIPVLIFLFCVISFTAVSIYSTINIRKAEKRLTKLIEEFIYRELTKKGGVNNEKNNK